MQKKEKNKLKDYEAQKIATNYLELVLLTNLSDNEGNRETFILDPDITLAAAKKYLFGLIDIDGSKNKILPLYYRLKDGC